MAFDYFPIALVVSLMGCIIFCWIWFGVRPRRKLRFEGKYEFSHQCVNCDAYYTYTTKMGTLESDALKDKKCYKCGCSVINRFATQSSPNVGNKP